MVAMIKYKYHAKIKVEQAIAAAVFTLVPKFKSLYSAQQMHTSHYYLWLVKNEIGFFFFRCSICIILFFFS